MILIVVLRNINACKTSISGRKYSDANCVVKLAVIVLGLVVLIVIIVQTITVSMN